MENDMDMLLNSDEMKGAKIIALEVDKAKKKTVGGIDYIHDVASTTSGAAAIGALSSTGTPLSLVLTTTSSVSGFLAAGASGLSWAITGESKYRNSFLFEFATIGVGAGARAIKSGKTITLENAKILQQVYKNNVSGFGWGISLMQ